MRHTVLPIDRAGTPVGAFGMLASARDWARFGLLYLDDGVVGGQRILPEGWVVAAATPTPGAAIGYGAGFWTNRGDSQGAKNRRHWGIPEESFYASGIFGQYVVMVPAARLVVVRLGFSLGPYADTPGVSRLVSEVLAALTPAAALNK
jgi:CubicO group peptidase (beta-lactamase class C family)